MLRFNLEKSQIAQIVLTYVDRLTPSLGRVIVLMPSVIDDSDRFSWQETNCMKGNHFHCTYCFIFPCLDDNISKK